MAQRNAREPLANDPLRKRIVQIGEHMDLHKLHPSLIPLIKVFAKAGTSRLVLKKPRFPPHAFPASILREEELLHVFKVLFDTVAGLFHVGRQSDIALHEVLHFVHVARECVVHEREV